MCPTMHCCSLLFIYAVQRQKMPLIIAECSLSLSSETWMDGLVFCAATSRRMEQFTENTAETPRGARESEPGTPKHPGSTLVGDGYR